MQTEINHEQVEELWAKAKAGDADSEFRLGVSYTIGRGVAKDEVEAVKWYRKAAEQNVAEAQNSLGTMYGRGLGVGKDYTEAAKWFRKAAEQNYGAAQFNLGLSYEYGQGVAKDVAQGLFSPACLDTGVRSPSPAFPGSNHPRSAKVTTFLAIRPRMSLGRS